MGLVTENGVLPNYSVSNVLFLHIVQTEFCQHFIFEVVLSSIILLHFIFSVLNSLTVCVSLSSISHALFWQEKKKKRKNMWKMQNSFKGVLNFYWLFIETGNISIYSFLSMHLIFASWSKAVKHSDNNSQWNIRG